MKHINKTIYWICLLVLFSSFLILQYKDYISIANNNILYTIFAIWICLILFPLFSEFEMFGIKFVKELNDFKHEVKRDILSIKNDINNTNSQQIFVGYGPPPSDTRIPELEKEINALKDEYHIDTSDDHLSLIKTMKASGLKGRFDVPDTAIFLFQIRYTIENTISQIWNNYFELIGKNKYTSSVRMLNDLKEAQVIDIKTLTLTREILSVCNSAVHGNTPTELQLEFVFKNSRIIYDRLNDFIPK